MEEEKKKAHFFTCVCTRVGWLTLLLAGIDIRKNQTSSYQSRKFVYDVINETNVAIILYERHLLRRNRRKARFIVNESMMANYNHVPWL